ncbi:MAG TPA: glycerate kinase [Solirubrobacterales bacterium]|nr:glycerate kinase [Solirubrobacterales bacterium]
MRFLVAPDSFKGTFDASEVAAAIAAGVEEAGAEADQCPVADGGEGTMDVLLAALGGERRQVEVSDPLRRPVVAEFALLDDETAVVETARASGLTLVAPEERDPEGADTYGAGELIAAAVEAGARTILVAVGGSATTDGGRGAIEALRDRGALSEVGRVEVLCDVRAPFEDAARLFAPQKGADPVAVERLTARLDALAAQLPRDPRGIPMSGCAGGLSGGIWAYGAQLRPGATFVLDAVDFDRRLAAADAIISGEGRLDAQSFAGKIVGEIADRSADNGKPLHLIVGEQALDGDDPTAVASVATAQTPKEMRHQALALARQA